MDAREWDDRYGGTEPFWKVGPNRFLVEEVGGLPPGRALDLGTGEGRNAVWLAEQGWQVTGVDFSQVGLGKAARLAAERGVHVDWVEADLRTYVPPVRSFDLVLVFYIHIPHTDLETILDRAADALTSGGTLLVVGHDRRNLAEGHGGPQDPDLLYTTEEVTGMLGGLWVERAECVLRPVESDQGSIDAIDTLVRFRRS